MKQKLAFTLILAVLFIFACDDKTPDAMIENYKMEVIQTEADFAEMAKEKGVLAAFLAFADENAVLMRGNKIIKGKANIKAHFETQAADYNDFKLMWKPDFVDVSASGDLAYTYGKYTSKVLRNDGTTGEGAGIFHTVWKRQADGSWKFVWD